MACAAPSMLSSSPSSAVCGKAGAAPAASLGVAASRTASCGLGALPKALHGLRRSLVLPLRSARPAAVCRSVRRSLSVNASSLPLVGNTAPDFEAEAVFDQEFIKVKLSDYIGKKYVILFFYPLDFTFVCPTEIIAFSDRYEEFEKLNTEVLGVSIDSVFSHLAWVQTDRKSGGLGDLKYPLVSDVTKSIAQSYGVLIPDQ
ncbi:hypothetical protein Taro_046038, partial [Colocasia esculenta]|nr:hypothetical protein [Colocasia esculenta]